MTVKKAIVPMGQGELMIPAVEVPYFNPAEKKYKTARTGPYKLSVLPARQSEALQAVVPGMSAAPKEDVQVLGRDVRPIYTGFDVIERASQPRLTAVHWFLLLAPACLYVLIIMIFSARVRRQSDSVRVRARSAWPRFKKQLPGLQSALDASKSDFYGEAGRALRDFIGDMFGAIGSALTSTEIRELLAGAGVSDDLVSKIVHALEQCDAGRYGLIAEDMSARQDLFKEVTRTARELHRSR